jgi:hypothetical protein
MFAIGKKVLCLLLLVCMAAAPLGCLTVNKEPEKQPKTEVNVGGDRGVNVDHHTESTRTVTTETEKH